MAIKFDGNIDAIHIEGESYGKVYVDGKLVWQRRVDDPAPASAIVGWTSLIGEGSTEVQLPSGVQDGDLLLWLGGGDPPEEFGFNAGPSDIAYKVAKSEPDHYIPNLGTDEPFLAIILALRGVNTDPASWQMALSPDFVGPGDYAAPSIPGQGKVLICMAQSFQFEGQAPVSITAPEGMTEIANYHLSVEVEILPGITLNSEISATWTVLEDPPNPTGERFFSIAGDEELLSSGTMTMLIPSA